MQSRLQTNLDDVSEVQFGFRSGKSTTDAIFALKTITSAYYRAHTPLHLIFVDYKKAFDSVNHALLMEKLEQMGVDRDVIRLTERLYHDAGGVLQWKNETTDAFNTPVGCRQGCPLSPILFSLYTECLMREWHARTAGLPGATIGDRTVKELRYADDLVLFALSAAEAETALNILADVSKPYQLVIHPGKTAHLVIKTDPNSTDTIHLGTSIIPNVNSFMYLGSTITYNTDDTPEISKRIAIAKTTLRECKYLRSPHLSVATKLLVIRALVMSRLTYGSTTWSIKNSDAAKLDAFGRTVWRWLLGVNWSDHVTNESLMRMIDGRWLFTYDTIVQRKMDWFSHIARQQGLQWDLLSGAVLGTVSSRGRPRMTWYDNIRASTGLTMEEAKQQALSRIHLRIRGHHPAPLRRSSRIALRQRPRTLQSL
ncbi:endonuclease-reverse transcriptase [Apostichopus japonicus]|uniref:Endonuclease-reverse transcriptase n=1 Tax=Stichopus japonicus TaxID=307972 RepID=A0A2G8L1Z9_STIJA|nr:endonuclease-reverse transcriptase [Apostichopus japonicus]